MRGKFQYLVGRHDTIGPRTIAYIDVEAAKGYIISTQVSTHRFLTVRPLFVSSSARRRQTAFGSVQGPKMIKTSDCLF